MLGGIVVFPEGKALVKKVMPTRPERPGQEVLDDALKFVGELMAEAAVRNLSVSGIGVGVPELVDLEGNITSGHTIAWRDLPIKASFSKMAPTVVESDVRAAALAEVHFGAGRPFHLFIYLTVGTGISYCLVQNGQPFAGARGNALIVGSGRFTTICPHCGEEFAPILEEIASGPAVVSRYNQQAATQALAAEDVVKAAESRDQKAIEILGTAGDALGTSTGLLINLLDPHAIIVGGGLGLAGGIFWERFIASTCRHIWADSSRNTPIVRATTGTDSGMIGAATGIYAHKLNIHNPKTKRNLIKSVPITKSIHSRTPSPTSTLPFTINIF